ncbi:aconitate hydratase AcnA [Metabacillus bambusae]|uniref:Aconitate hydratase n=1 Tax=Metabacillus bambusae TaxID=2795218 RepID=A0ABS3N013_9BACI|nr:aconitate hydratase AcnA [Metabacillus bambusae]MBO1511505.1 aconitate hydratase AcnA [Metabacillus bambusae]
MNEVEMIHKSKKHMKISNKVYQYFALSSLEESGIGNLSKLPYSIKVLLEAALRNYDGVSVTLEHVKKLANWGSDHDPNQEVPFKPARILLHDTTGIPTLVDLAAMRESMKRIGGEVSDINPLIPVDLVVDHSLTVDHFGTPDAMKLNEKLNFERNLERFRFLRWAQKSFSNFNVIPPATGIMHQINMELLSSVAFLKEEDGNTIIYPDSLVGTDSHTTMVNGLGIVAWGVGGIEAEAAMLGQPVYFVTPEVVGFKFVGQLPEGTTATDLALTVTSLLRKKGVVGKFIEFFGPGIKGMSVADRATLANMAPEYGATMGLFPVDQETLDYLKVIGRSKDQILLIEHYYKTQGMFMTDESPEPIYSDIIELDLSLINPCLAGPKRPQDNVELTKMKEEYNKIIRSSISEGGFDLTEEDLSKTTIVNHQNGTKSTIKNGSVVLAAITSCTNTSNPNVLIAAGLVAKKAVERGLNKQSYVKTSLTPGSLVVTDYLKESGLLNYLEQLGFHIAGYGCATCIGNSGPLPQEVNDAIVDNDLVVAGVLSGNRNFEGRIHPQIKANYLASPPLVIAYAIAGTVDIDFHTEPIGFDSMNKPVYLRELWPSSQEIQMWLGNAISPELFKKRYQDVYNANKEWNSIQVSEGDLYDWDEESTYIQEPPFLKEMKEQPSDIVHIKGARTLAILGDSVTTDHLSPSGAIKSDSVSGLYLQQKGVEIKDFNSYPSRRGNHEVMVRGALANLRIRNQLVPGYEGGITKYFPTGEILSMYDASIKYREDHTSLFILAGKEYGTGSSRDWAAKGPYLLGVKAVLAESFERIHRSNLVGMGILPLQFLDGENVQSLGIAGDESFETIGLNNSIKPAQHIKIKAIRPDTSSFEFDVKLRLDNVVEIEYYRNGGIMQSVLRQMVNSKNDCK